MKRTLFALTSIAAMMAGPALAFPPTAIPSPGYDRALAESRKARQMPPPVYIEPAYPPIKRKLRHRLQR